MTRSEILSVIAYLAQLYEDYKRPSDAALVLWEEGLRDVSTREAFEAIKDHYLNCRYPVHLSDIVRGVRNQKLNTLPSEGEAWNQAYNMISSNDDLEVHPAVAKAVEMYGGKQLMKDRNVNYLRAEFQKTYREVRDGHIDGGKSLLTKPKSEENEEYLRALHYENERVRKLMEQEPPFEYKEYVRNDKVIPSLREGKGQRS